MCNTVIPKRFKGFKGKEKHLHQHILNNNIKLITHTVNVTWIHTHDVQDYISTHTFTIHICFFGTLLRQTPIPSHSQDINKATSSVLKFLSQKTRREKKVEGERFGLFY